MKITTISFQFDRFKVITRTLTGRNMHDVFYAIRHKQIKHINCYTIYYYDCWNGIYRSILASKFDEITHNMIPYKIVYTRTYDFTKWQRYRDAKGLTCQTCKHYLRWTVNGMTTVIHLCNKVPTHVLVLNSPTLESDQMLSRHPKCPFIYESVEYKLE